MCVKCIHRYWALTHLFPGVWNSVQSFGRRHLHVGDSLGSSDPDPAGSEAGNLCADIITHFSSESVSRTRCLQLWDFPTGMRNKENEGVGLFFCLQTQCYQLAQTLRREKGCLSKGHADVRGHQSWINLGRKLKSPKRRDVIRSYPGQEKKKKKTKQEPSIVNSEH